MPDVYKRQGVSYHSRNLIYLQRLVGKKIFGVFHSCLNKRSFRRLVENTCIIAVELAFAHVCKFRHVFGIPVICKIGQDVHTYFKKHIKRILFNNVGIVTGQIPRKLYK